MMIVDLLPNCQPNYQWNPNIDRLAPSCELLNLVNRNLRWRSFNPNSDCPFFIVLTSLGGGFIDWRERVTEVIIFKIFITYNLHKQGHSHAWCRGLFYNAKWPYHSSKQCKYVKSWFPEINLPLFVPLK